jgi:serine O-acetyltransferase
MLILKLWRASIWCHKHRLRPLSRLFKTLIFLGWGAILEPEVTLEGHVNFAHKGLGVVIHGSTVLEDWVMIWQYVTIASNNDKATGFGVRVGRGAVLGAHCMVMCPADRSITIGAEARIAAGAIVVDDVPEGALVLPESSRMILREKSPEA